MKKRSRRLAVLLLLVVTCLGSGMTIVLQKIVSPSIQENRQALRNQALLSVIPAQSYDNQPFQHPLSLPHREEDFPVIDGFLATLGGQPGAVIFHSRAQGYAGPVELLIGLSLDGKLIGFKVLKHNETLGLGGRIVSEPQWLNSLLGKSLTDPDEADWKLKQDGGAFDQIAGATITSRGVIETIHETLRYFDSEKARLLPDTTGVRP